MPSDYAAPVWTDREPEIKIGRGFAASPVFIPVRGDFHNPRLHTGEKMKQISKWTLAILAAGIFGLSQFHASAADTTKGLRIGNAPEVTASVARQAPPRCPAMALTSVERTHDLDSKGHTTITESSLAFSGKDCVTKPQREGTSKQVSTASSCPAMGLTNCKTG